MFVFRKKIEKQDLGAGVILQELGYGEHMNVLHWNMSDGAEVKWHVHKEEQFGYVIKGGFKMKIGDEEVELHEGDAYFVPPDVYFSLKMNERYKLARMIGKLNQALHESQFILVGPGRWGSTNTDLGIPIGYSDIFNTRALVELSGSGIGPDPEPSLGTHFFQDLLEAQIYPLAVMLDDPLSILQPSFFYHAPNQLTDFIEAEEHEKEWIRVISINQYRRDHLMRLVMDEERSTALGYLVAVENQEQAEKNQGR